MDVLIDTNVIINFITDREDPYREASNRIMELCANESFRGYIAFHSLSTVWYVIRKYQSEQEARFWLEKLCALLTVTGADQKQVMEAIRNQDFRDFEDCLQDACAQHCHAQYLVTCNLKDYTHAKTKVVTPDVLLSVLNPEG